jgi:DNA polymerase III alpha subunit
MGKKNKVELDRYAVEFINGCIKSGIDKSYANSLWETLLGFAD